MIVGRVVRGTAGFGEDLRVRYSSPPAGGVAGVSPHPRRPRQADRSTRQPASAPSRGGRTRGRRTGAAPGLLSRPRNSWDELPAGHLQVFDLPAVRGQGPRLDESARGTGRICQRRSLVFSSITARIGTTSPCSPSGVTAVAVRVQVISVGFCCHSRSPCGRNSTVPRFRAHRRTRSIRRQPGDRVPEGRLDPGRFARRHRPADPGVEGHVDGGKKFGSFGSVGFRSFR